MLVEEAGGDTARHLHCAVVLRRDDMEGDHWGETKIRIARVQERDHDRQGRDRGLIRRDLGVERRREGQGVEGGIARHRRRGVGGEGGVRATAVIVATAEGVGAEVGEVMEGGGKVDAGKSPTLDTIVESLCTDTDPKRGSFVA